MQKDKPVFSSPTEKEMSEPIIKQIDRVQILPNSNPKKACQSAAMLGLALSMGTTGILLLTQKSHALAADKIAPEYLMGSLAEYNAKTDNDSQPEIIAPEVVTEKENLTQDSQKEKISLVAQKEESETAVSEKEIAAVQLPPIRLNPNQIQSTETARKIGENYGLQPEQLDPYLPQITDGSVIAEPANNIEPGPSDEEIAPTNNSLATELAQINPQEPTLIETKDNGSTTVAATEIGEIELQDRPISIPVPLPESASASVESNSKLTYLNNTQALPKPYGVQPIVASTTPDNKYYRVKKGDTLDSIARQYGITRRELMAFNRINNPNLIKINQQLKIPVQNLSNNPSEEASLMANMPLANDPRNLNRVRFAKITTTSVNNTNELDQENNPYLAKLRSDVVKLKQDYQNSEGDNRLVEKSGNNDDFYKSQWQQRLQKPSSNSDNKSKEQIISAAPTSVQDYNSDIQLPAGANVGPDLPPLSSPDKYLPENPDSFTNYIWPSKGVLSSGYGRRWGRMHRGIDIAGPVGTPIVAAAPGEVISAGWNSGGYGNLVKIRHIDGSVTLYAHNSRILVSAGQTVEQGQQISEMGNTGFSTGPHLHFEVHASGRGAVNPMAFLPKKRR